MTVFFMFLLAGAAIAIAVSPLVKPPLEAGSVPYLGEDEMQLLRQKKEIVYGNIIDLDFEFKMGKLSEADYTRLRQELKLEAALIMENISRAKKGQGADAVLEAEIRTRRAKIRSAAEERDVPAGASLIRCPQCQTPHQAQSKFCSECGCNLHA